MRFMREYDATMPVPAAECLLRVTRQHAAALRQRCQYYASTRDAMIARRKHR